MLDCFFLINKSLYFVNIIQPRYYMILHDITGTILLYIGYVKLYYYTQVIDFILLKIENEEYFGSIKFMLS